MSNSRSRYIILCVSIGSTGLYGPPTYARTYIRYAFRVQHHPEQLPGCVAPVLDKHVEEEILI